MSESIKWLQKNKRFIKISVIEIELGMADTILSKAVNEKQALSKHWDKPLNEFLTELKK
jgi:hypothetical protein